MNAAEAKELLDRTDLTAAQMMRAHGTILASPYGYGSQALMQQIALGVSALCLVKAQELERLER